jgi:hypothetical protein
MASPFTDSTYGEGLAAELAAGRAKELAAPSIFSSKNEPEEQE